MSLITEQNTRVISIQLFVDIKASSKRFFSEPFSKLAILLLSALACTEFEDATLSAMLT